MNNDGFNQQLNKSSLERDVGVLISNDMKWGEQVRAATAKANSMLGMLSKAFSYKGKELMRSLYCTYVRPHLEFAIQVWNPYLQKDMKRLKIIISLVQILS
jgi:ribonuclease P/MRP protein subunit RPP40